MKNFTRMMTLTIVCLLCASFSTNAATILSETFATSLGNFTTQSLKGDQGWAWSTYKDQSFAKMTGYVSGVNNENDDWLISPPMDFSDVTKANLTFMHAHRYGANSVIELTLMVTDSYTGGAIDTTKWKSIDFSHSTGASFDFIESGLLALDEFAGKESVRFAFRYKSSSTAGATWEVNNVLVESVVDNAPKIVFEEDFANFTAGTQDTPGSEVTATLDNYTKLPGWTGSKIYTTGGSLKMGSSSALGSLVTPSIDLSGNSGNFNLYMDSRAWSGDATSLKVYVNDVLAIQVDGLSNAAAPYTCSPFGPYALTGGTATTKIKFEGMQASKGRFFIDNVKITQGGAVEPTASFTSSGFTSKVGNTLSQDVVLKASNVTGNLTVSLTNKVGNAFSTTTTTVTKEQATSETGYAIPVVYLPTKIEKDTAIISVSGGGLKAPITTAIGGVSWDSLEVADLAALRKAFDANTWDTKSYYTVKGEVFVNYTNTSGNSKYLQDATGGAMIYDTKGLITTSFAIGDGMKNLKGTLTAYGKLLEIIPVGDVAVSSTGNVITAKTLTIPEAKANLGRYESTLIQINNLTCGKTGVFGTAKANYNFGVGADTIVIRTNYTGMDYMGTAIPTGATNIRGILIQYNGTAQFVPRSLADFGVPAGLKPVTSGMKVYGKEGILNVVANNGQVIEVYNILGRKLLSTVAKDGINSFSLGRNQVILVKTGNMTSKVIL